MIEETLLEAGEKMDKAIEVAKEDFASVRTGGEEAAGVAPVDAAAVAGEEQALHTLRVPLPAPGADRGVEDLVPVLRPGQGRAGG